MEWSLGSFGDMRLDQGGARSSNGWSRARRCACAGWGVTVVANCKRAGSSPTRKHAPAKAGVTAAKIVEGWSERTGAAVAGRHVLAIQDTTEVKFPTTAERRRGLGPVKKGNTYGVLAHVMIAVDADSHACLGLVGGDVRTRDGVVTEPHRDRPLSERESRRWIETAGAGQAGAVISSDGDSGGRPRKRHVPRLGQRAATGLSSAEPGHACPCEACPCGGG
jgi:hypothetical protein